MNIATINDLAYMYCTATTHDFCIRPCGSNAILSTLVKHWSLKTTILYH